MALAVSLVPCIASSPSPFTVSSDRGQATKIVKPQSFTKLRTEKSENKSGDFLTSLLNAFRLYV